MTDFLVVSGISLNTINQLKKNENLLSDLYDNKDEFINITNYLRMIGIKNIEEVLIYKPELFLESKDNLIYSLSQFDLPTIVNMINEDCTNIDLVYEVD
jgi:hypothetical protein